MNIKSAIFGQACFSANESAHSQTGNQWERTKSGLSWQRRRNFSRWIYSAYRKTFSTSVPPLGLCYWLLCPTLSIVIGWYNSECEKLSNRNVRRRDLWVRENNVGKASHKGERWALQPQLNVFNTEIAQINRSNSKLNDYLAHRQGKRYFIFCKPLFVFWLVFFI